MSSNKRSTLSLLVVREEFLSQLEVKGSKVFLEMTQTLNFEI